MVFTVQKTVNDSMRIEMLDVSIYTSKYEVDFDSSERK